MGLIAQTIYRKIRFCSVLGGRLIFTSNINLSSPQTSLYRFPRRFIKCSERSRRQKNRQNKTMEAIVYENPRIFTPDALLLEILRAVYKKQGCPIRHVVSRLITDNGERMIRRKVHELLGENYLDGGSPANDIILRLTSKGRILLQQTA